VKRADRQRRNAVITGITLAAAAVGLYAYVVLKFMGH
jgi:hypothetical protein